MVAREQARESDDEDFVPKRPIHSDKIGMSFNSEAFPCYPRTILELHTGFTANVSSWNLLEQHSHYILY